MANPYLKSQPEERVIPPKDPEERVRFWIDRGNATLWSEGRTDLHWRHSNGHYFVEPR